MKADFNKINQIHQNLISQKVAFLNFMSILSFIFLSILLKTRNSKMKSMIYEYQKSNFKIKVKKVTCNQFRLLLVTNLSKQLKK
jgi:hypothetical protein